MKKHVCYTVIMGIIFLISNELQAQVYYSGCTATSSKQASAIGLNSSSTGNQSLASGNYATASGNYSTALGSYVQATGSNAFTFGSGISTSGYLINSTAKSFLVGFDNKPVLFAQLHSSLSGTPRVGIGTKTPAYTLDVNGDANFDKVYTNRIYFTGVEMRITKYAPGSNPSPPSPGDGMESDLGSGSDRYEKDIITITKQGAVGIGTTSPQVTLDVVGDIHTNAFLEVGESGKMKNLELTGLKPSGFFRYLQLGDKGLFGSYLSHTYLWGSNWTSDNIDNYVRIQQGTASAITLNDGERIYLMTAPDGPANSIIDYSYVCIHKGNLGIGTYIPSQALDVNGNAYIQGNLGVKTSNPQYPLHVTGNSYITGNVGIGSAPSSTYKLGVNGKIGCKEIVVTNSGWADYVFEPDYELMTLDELESFIQDNKRLPEIPSAAHVEENGVELSAMNVLLLKKVEELTLYILEQNKRIETLEKAAEVK